MEINSLVSDFVVNGSITYLFKVFLITLIARSAVSIRQRFKSNVRPPPPSSFVRKIITFCEEDLRVVRMLVALGSLKL